MSDIDVIDEILAIAPGDRLDAVRSVRPQARENAQRSYEALFEPVAIGGVSLADRAVVAAFTSALLRESDLAEFYRAAAVDHGAADLLAALDAAVAESAVVGPYGAYRESGLAAESTGGLRWQPGPELESVLGVRLARILAHAHLLVFRPREASAAALHSLLDAGWSTTDVVTLSQLVAFVNFQARVVIGLRALQRDIEKEQR
ncbi:CMD domain protein [Mycetocola reblochoni]|uniref:CMD domain protein n=2 Tax=Mycetocola reblochoni TaxID=331618 RepID=A0A1R4K6N4_9MICO|nr:CMD domain protein [Mycetocola reblochoni]RLP68010.1 CMD domain protein [Mycetocola reblochoni]SJN39683.1 hypothetical protein FM119_11555 [Mycetocola reblochoni REB411]